MGVNVQERALREGREAMFGALTGVRGGSRSVFSPSCFFADTVNSNEQEADLYIYILVHFQISSQQNHVARSLPLPFNLDLFPLPLLPPLRPPSSWKPLCNHGSNPSTFSHYLVFSTFEPSLLDYSLRPQIRTRHRSPPRRSPLPP